MFCWNDSSSQYCNRSMCVCMYECMYSVVVIVDVLQHPNFSLYNSILSSLYGGYSSSFSGGGACLSHDHNTQFRFVLQSFTLWKEIMTNMPKLWLLADHDMTHEQYRLVELQCVCSSGVFVCSSSVYCIVCSINVCVYQQCVYVQLQCMCVVIVVVRVCVYDMALAVLYIVLGQCVLA